MQNGKWYCLAALILVLMFAFAAFGAEEAAAEYVPAAYGTMWALLPPVVAIGLALITKEVYSSLFVGILVGSVLYSGMNFEVAVTHMFENGVTAFCLTAITWEFWYSWLFWAQW